MTCSASFSRIIPYFKHLYREPEHLALNARDVSNQITDAEAFKYRLDMENVRELGYGDRR